MKRVVVLVSGQVQGVGYRNFARTKAVQLGLCGYVENLGDGRVEVVAEGPEEALKQLLEFLCRGPRFSKVSSLDIQWSQATGLRGFETF